MTRDALGVAMERYARGDASAFGEVHDALSPKLDAFLTAQTRNRHLAEDLRQQTFLQVHKHRARFKPGAAVETWVFAIARRLLIDLFRRSKLDARLPITDAPSPERPDDLACARQVGRFVAETVDRLPENQRVAFEMLKGEGCSLVETAQALGTSVTAVKLRVHRAYVALRGVLRECA
ncbi:MAG: RNA polymerase sigma factor [Deltaproteobacteria bacterium]|nr:RNA polymerase sigma factor [Deltaproteobacteria bacterium]